MAKKNPVKKRFVTEPTAYAEVGTYLHRLGDGRAKVKSYTSVNEPLRVMAAEDTKQVLRLRVETHVKECKDVQDDGSFYEKDVKVKQIREDFESEETTPVNNTTQSVSDSSVPDGTVRPGMDKADYLKNFMDKIFDKVRDLDTKVMVIGAIAVVALVLAAVAYGNLY